MKDPSTILVPADSDIRTAIKIMDTGGRGFIAVVDADQNVEGIVTDGDFRRAILRGTSLNDRIATIINRDFVFLDAGYVEQDVLELFRKTTVKQIPVLKNGRLVELIIEKDFLEKEPARKTPPIHLPVIIMAGGKGSRLDPFTRILPKALIPIGEKPIIEHIIEEFLKNGFTEFVLSLNHKSNMIKAFFAEYERNYDIKFIEEDKPLGTAGALKYLEGGIATTFFVTNCDILIKEEYSKILDFHRNGKFDLTIVASIQNHVVPYGVCRIEGGGNLVDLVEKPEFDFLVNTGFYILEPRTLEYIPKNEFFHITRLIEEIKKNGLRVGVYPISKNAWIDVGQWTEYSNALGVLNPVSS